MRDAPPRSGPGGGLEEHDWSVGGAQPVGVLRPVDPGEVREALGEAAAKGWGVVPLGGRTQPGCEPPTEPFVALDTGALTGIEDYEPADLTVSAAAGTRLEELSATLAGQGQWIPCDPPFAARRSLGGVVACGASGDLGTAFGALRDHVLGLTVVTGDGRVLRLGGRVMKNVAGFDLVRLMVGSRGTLGVVTSATLRVFPRPAQDRVLVFEGTSVEDLLPLAARIRSAPVLPASAVLSGSAGTGGASLTVRVQGPEAAVQADARRLCGPDLGRATVLDAREGAGRDALEAARRAASRAELVVRAAALPDRLPAVLSLLGRALPPFQWRVDILTGRVRAAADEAGAEAPRLLHLRREMEAMGGTLSLERAPRTLVREVGAYGPEPGAAALRVALKRALDPRGVLSPGRFVR